MDHFKSGVVALAMCLAVAGTVGAQVESGSSPEFIRVQQLLKVGQLVAVQTAAGETVRGRYVFLRPDGLGVQTKNGQRLIPTGEISEITRTRPIGTGLGLWIGTGVGMAFGAAARSYELNTANKNASASFWIPTAIGAAVGLAVDAARSSKVVYRKNERR